MREGLCFIKRHPSCATTNHELELPTLQVYAFSDLGDHIEAAKKAARVAEIETSRDKKRRLTGINRTPTKKERLEAAKGTRSVGIELVEAWIEAVC